MNQVTKTESSVPGNPGDPYTAYGKAVAGDGAQFLKFVKGQFQYGPDSEELPLKTQLVPNMSELQAGYIKWHNSEPVDHAMIKIAEGQPMPQRLDLDAQDSDEWETGPDGVAIDPWSDTNLLPFKDPQTGLEFVFTTSSNGGRNAIGKLATAYGSQRSRHDGKLPIVEIGCGSYRHKVYGDVQYPIFRIVGWQTEAELIAGETDGNLDEEIDDSIPF